MKMFLAFCDAICCTSRPTSPNFLCATTFLISLAVLADFFRQFLPRDIRILAVDPSRPGLPWLAASPARAVLVAAVAVVAAIVTAVTAAVAPGTSSDENASSSAQPISLLLVAQSRTECPAVTQLTQKLTWQNVFSTMLTGPDLLAFFWHKVT